MAIFPLSGLRHDKIYHTDGLNATLKIKKPQVNIVFNETHSIEETKRLNKLLRIIPNTPLRLVYPPNKVNFTSLKDMQADSTRRISFYKEAKANIQGLVRIDSLQRIKSDKLIGKKVFFDFSSLRQEFDSYMVTNKKNFLYGIKAFKFLFSLMERYVPGEYGKRIVINIGEKEDFFQKTLVYFIQKQFDDASEFFKKYEIIFTTSNGYVYKPSMWRSQDKGRILSFLTKLHGISANKKVDLSDVEKLASVPEEKLVVGHDDNDDYEESQATEHPNDVKLDKHDDKKPDLPVVDDAGNAPSDYSPIDNGENPELLDNVGDNEPSGIPDLDAINFDEIPEELIAESENSIQEENKKFIEDNIALQEEALKPFNEKLKNLDSKLEPQVIKDDTIMNENLKAIKVNSITSSYYKKQHLKDTLNILTSLNSDSEQPMVVTSIDIKDNSDSLNLKDELKVTFKDKANKTHTFLVDVPKMSHDGFLYLAGDKKFISKQAIAIPVIKSDIDTVQVTTNYNKVFLYRKGQKIDRNLDRYLKTFTNHDHKSIKVENGNTSLIATKNNLPLDYIYLSKHIFRITFSKGLVFTFNGGDTNEDVVVMLDNGKDKIYFDKKDRTFKVKLFGKEYSFDNIGDVLNLFITNNNELKEIFERYSPSKSVSFSSVKIASSEMALGVVLSSLLGLDGLLKRMNVNFTLHATRPKVEDNEILLRFKDGFISLKPNKVEDYLVLNSLTQLNTSDYPAEDMMKRMSPIFIEYYGEKTVTY